MIKSILRFIRFIVGVAILGKILRRVLRRHELERFMSHIGPRIMDTYFTKADPAHRQAMLTRFREVLESMEKKYGSSASNGKAKHSDLNTPISGPKKRARPPARGDRPT